MMDFVLMTLSFAVAILLASFVACVIMLNKKVMKAYLKYVNKMVNEVSAAMFEED
mgnify:CR=1 FL=1